MDSQTTGSKAELDAQLADEIAGIARIGVDDLTADDVLQRVVRLVTRRIERCAAAAVTIGRPADAGTAPSRTEHTFAASDQRVVGLHDVQFDAGSGPAVEALRYGEARHLDDAASSDRWPEFAAAVRAAGFASCLALPVRTDRSSGGALVLYSRERGAFGGRPHHIPLLVAAETGVALGNVDVYHDALRAIDNLRSALETRALIERAKAIIAVDRNVSLEEAFDLLSRQSQRERRKASEVARDLVSRRLGDGTHQR